MKLFYLSVIIAFQFFSIPIAAQTNLQAGAAGVFSKTKGKGFELSTNLKAARGFSIGLGIAPIKFEEHKNWYIPFFGSLQYYYALKKSMLFGNLHPGWGIYPLENITDGGGIYSRKGTVYLSAGLGIAGKSALAPYASLNFTKFGFRESIGGTAIYRPISTFVLSAGIMLNHSVPEKLVFSKKIKEPLLTQQVIAMTTDDYLKLSVRQRKTGNVFLITGSALIVSSIAVFASQKKDDDIKGPILAISLGLPGILSSIISIPIFVASRQNQKKALKMRDTGF